MDSIAGIGLRGVQAGMENAARDAQRVTEAFKPESDQDPVEPLVSLKLDEYQVKASSVVVKTAKTLQDSILDILA